MSSGRREAFTPPTTYLPPRELWLFDPNREGLLPTPTDDYGLVDKERLITMIQTTVTPDYTWESPFLDTHHLQWPDRWYERDDTSKESPHVFRNLPVNKVQLPRIFHNWIHRITEPPPLPDEEVMRHRIAAQFGAISLYQEVKNSKTAARRKRLGQEGLERMLRQRFDSFAVKFERAKEVPKEFQMIDYDSYPLETIGDMVTIGTHLGKYAIVPTAKSRLRRGRTA